MKYFFWIAFAVFLAASIPHVAYFFASFEPSQGPEGVWWWAVSYAIAISIDVTVYLLSWTAFRRYRKYRTPRAVWQHWLLIVICTVFSWGVNWAYAKQFHSPVMLSSAESTAPWLTSVFPFMASAFPLLGIVYTMMAETITEASVEDHLEKEQHLTALGELAKQTQLPIATLQRALTAGSARLSASTLLTTLNQRSPSTVSAPETTELEKSERPITGKFVTIEGDAPNVGRTVKQSSNPALVSVSNDVNPDKLQMTIEALKARPDMTDEALAEFLSLKRPASARFWRLKAIEILNAPDKETSEVAPRGSWAGSITNEVSAAR
jgi:DNA-binding transcriptional regulator YhcF (GntR family)